MINVPHTCPDIDKIIKSIRLIEKLSDNCYFNFTSQSSEDIYDCLSDIRYEISGLEGLMEGIRAANAQLRENAEYMETELSAAQQHL